MFFSEQAGTENRACRPIHQGRDSGKETPPQVGATIRAPLLQENIAIPPGLIGDVCRFIYDAAPHPNPDIAMAGAIAFVAGICGKSYNTYTNAGLNQYILLLASTGMGKEAAASGIAKLFNAIGKTVPAAGEFKGPALVSSAGLLKWLDKKPSVVSIIGEFGYKLKAISSPKANPNDEMLKATLLDLYGKSGAGSVVDPMAYSDRDKHTDVIQAPSLTLLGESVPGVVYEALNDSVVLSGLLPRFMLIEARGNRSPLQEAPAMSPNPMLTQALADLCATSLTLNRGHNVHTVPADPEARAKFREFGQWVTDQINGNTSEIYRELWNRAHLKALKLATLCAVGINPNDPVVTINETMWATNVIVGQVMPLLARFEAGDVGQLAGSQSKQEREIMRVIAEYCTKPWEACSKYHGTKAMHDELVITKAHIQQRLYATASFKDDKQGPKAAVERGLKSLCEADIIREVPRAQMVERFGKQAYAFAPSDPQAILSAAGADV